MATASGPVAAVPDALVVPVQSKSFAGALGADQDITPPCRAVRCGTAGNLKVRWATGGVEDTIPKVTDGETIQGQIDKIFSSGTTAQDITIFW